MAKISPSVEKALRTLDYASPQRNPRFDATLTNLAVPWGWKTQSLAALMIAVLFWSETVPAGRDVIGGAMIVPYLLLILIWFVRCFFRIVWLCRRWLWRDQWSFKLLSDSRGFAIFFLMTALSYAAIQAGVPVRFTFWVSRSAMDRFAGQVITGAIKPPYPSHLGFFAVDAVQQFPGGVKFAVPANGRFIGNGGFAYSPSGPPPAASHILFQQLSGPWYMWKFDDD